jgi:LysM repeat protein
LIYTVAAGDTLYDIAIRFNTTVNAIMQANGLTSTSLAIGQKLIIPVATPTPTPAAAALLIFYPDL